MLKDSSVDVEVSQKFSIKVDQQDYRISQFLTSIPLPFKKMLSLRKQAGQDKDTKLNVYYNQGLDVAAYQKQEQTIISLNNKGSIKEELRFVFMK